MNSFYSESELKKIGFKRIGNNVQLSRKASIYSPETIQLGNNVRIDDFCILSGTIIIGDYVHISASSLLFGGDEGIVVGNYSGISSRCAIYAISDDYSGNCMANATIPMEFRHVISKKITIGRHVVIGSGCTILPGANIVDGVAVGAMSLVNKPIEIIGIYCGIPAAKIKDRSPFFLEMEKKLLERNK